MPTSNLFQFVLAATVARHVVGVTANAGDGAVCTGSSSANNTFIKDCQKIKESTDARNASDCCSMCQQDAECETWVFATSEPTWTCKLCSSDGHHLFQPGAVSGGVNPFPPAPAPAPVPPPAPAPPVPPFVPGAPNIIVLLTDDQVARGGRLVVAAIFGCLRGSRS